MTGRLQQAIQLWEAAAVRFQDLAEQVERGAGPPDPALVQEAYVVLSSAGQALIHLLFTEGTPADLEEWSARLEARTAAILPVVLRLMSDFGPSEPGSPSRN